MLKKICYFLIFILSFAALGIAQTATTIDQLLNVVRNDRSTNGVYKVEVRVQGNNLPAGKTLGSATLDINYDNTKLQYIASSDWIFNYYNGYGTVVATNEGTFIRVGVLGTGVNAIGNGVPAGVDLLEGEFQLWVILEFKILAYDYNTTLSIQSGSNQIGLFLNPHDNPRIGTINNQPLSVPLFTDNTPLPVELTSFTAKVKGDNVQLNWETATEVTNYGFDIERKTEKTEWLKIGFVKGSGNSNSPKGYTFNDKPFGESKYQYRLKQIDTDGKYKYYDAIEVHITPSHFAIEQNYPNPFNPSTSIRFQLPKESRVNLRIYNMLGQEVAVLINETMEAGFKDVKFDASKLSSGTYLYRIEAGEFTQTKKMVLIK